MALNIVQAMNDPTLFAAWFKDRETWVVWRTFLAALFALPMTAEQMATYSECTGRTEAPKERSNEAWLVCGRRSGKSFVLALVAVFLATFFNWRPCLSPGENGFIIIIAADRKQAQTIFRYLKALLLEVPMLATLVAAVTAESIELTNGVVVEVATCSYRTVRGRTIIAALCDEVAFWPSEYSASPDYEVLDALRPGMATVPGAMLLCASSPYARRGALWDAYSRFYGKVDAPALVWKAPTLIMNPTVPERVIDEAYERDPVNAAAEYGASFRNDIAQFLTRNALGACVTPDCYERSRVQGLRYQAFVDPSGGVSDSMTLAIGHSQLSADKSIAVLDAIREIKAPFSPDEAVKEFAALLKTYGIRSVRGDRYSAEWCASAFRKVGVEYRAADLSKSEIYRDFLPRLNSGEIDLLDNARLITQLLSLERRTARGGRDSIDHPVGGRDDIANAVAGCLVYLTSARHQPAHHSGTVGHSFIRRRAKTLYDQPHVVPAILEGGAEARLQPDDMAWPIYSGWLVLWMRYRVSWLPS
jgi:hypothetical protein